MKEQKTTSQTMNRGFLNGLAFKLDRAGFAGSAVLMALKEIITRAAWLKKPKWEQYARRLYTWCYSAKVRDNSPPPFNIFAEGNAKLPFLSYASLPGINCPGAGACWQWIKGKFMGWCYSVKAWRYPAAFMRQLQNTILERGPVYRLLIIAELRRQYSRRKYSGAAVPFRLYVDGDFANLELLRFWMDTIKQFPRLSVYGYSKSLHLFEQLDKTGYDWPTNYALNGSSGGKYENSKTAAYVQTLPIWRGEFVAVPVSKATGKAWKKQTMKREHTAEIRAKFAGSKVFICPGKCGTCTAYKAAPHACGNLDTFKNTKIVIPIH